MESLPTPYPELRWTCFLPGLVAAIGMHVFQLAAYVATAVPGAWPWALACQAPDVSYLRSYSLSGFSLVAALIAWGGLSKEPESYRVGASVVMLAIGAQWVYAPWNEFRLIPWGPYNKGLILLAACVWMFRTTAFSPRQVTIARVMCYTWPLAALLPELLILLLSVLTFGFGARKFYLLLGGIAIVGMVVVWPDPSQYLKTVFDVATYVIVVGILILPKGGIHGIRSCNRT